MFIFYWIRNTWRQLEVSDKIQIFLSLLPLITVIVFIYQTILTRDSVKLAQQDFYVRNSPYLVINNIMYDHFLTNDSITFILKVENFGQSPAFNVLASDITVYEIPPNSFTNNFLFDSLEFQIVPEKHISNGFYVKSNAVCTGTDYRYEDKFLIGQLLYRDIFNRTLYTTFAG